MTIVSTSRSSRLVSVIVAFRFYFEKGVYGSRWVISVAWMKRSGIRGQRLIIPDSAALHPGYGFSGQNVGLIIST
jgi:hypothetical protein